MPARIAAFPKCYLEQISTGQMSVFEWIDMAKQLDADGLEMYSGFFVSFEDAYIDSVGEAISDAGFAMPMLCCSPDFTHPDPDHRRREIDREAEMIRITRRLGGRRAVCRVLSGQRYPELSWEEGRERVLACFAEVLPIAREFDVILGLENHYKDGFWHYPEFAQKMDRFVSLVEAVSDREHFGVQYDPSNAVVAGDDPVDLLERIAPRVVSMHASDRYLAEGATLDDLAANEGSVGYAQALCHGVTGKGLNDYHAIFRILAKQHYSGWISIEDGMNGMEEMAESLRYLREMNARYLS